MGHFKGEIPTICTEAAAIRVDSWSASGGQSGQPGLVHEPEHERTHHLQWCMIVCLPENLKDT